MKMKRHLEVLLGIFEVVLVLHPKEESQLRRLLNLAKIVFQTMGGGKEHVPANL